MSLQRIETKSRIFFFDGDEVQAALVAYLESRGFKIEFNETARVTSGGGSATVTFKQSKDLP